MSKIPWKRNRTRAVGKGGVIGLLLAILFVLGAAVISLFVGAYDISAGAQGREMFFITRIPRTLALMLTGAAMAISGQVMQLITQNRMVEPTTTGTMEWAGLGLLLVYLLVPDPSIVVRMAGAIIFSFVGTMVFFLFLRKIRLKSSLMVPIIGIMLGAVVSSISNFLGLTFQASQVVENWFVGSFSSIQIGKYEYLWVIILITLAIYYYADRLTMLGLGRDISKSLGLDYDGMVLLGTGLISLAVGVVAAVVGSLPFLGLIIPNIVSLYRGDDLRSNLPWVSLFGMGTILVCDIISRALIMPYEIPVSLILGTVGSLVFIILILKRRGALS